MGRIPVRILNILLAQIYDKIAEYLADVEKNAKKEEKQTSPGYAGALLFDLSLNHWPMACCRGIDYVRRGVPTVLLSSSHVANIRHIRLVCKLCFGNNTVTTPSKSHYNTIHNRYKGGIYT